MTAPPTPLRPSRPAGGNEEAAPPPLAPQQPPPHAGLAMAPSPEPAPFDLSSLGARAPGMHAPPPIPGGPHPGVDSAGYPGAMGFADPAHANGAAMPPPAEPPQYAPAAGEGRIDPVLAAAAGLGAPGQAPPVRPVQTVNAPDFSTLPPAIAASLARLAGAPVNGASGPAKPHPPRDTGAAPVRKTS